MNMHSNALSQQGLHANVALSMLNHQHQHSSTQNPLRLPTKYAMAFGMVRRPAESAALRVWRVTWNHSHAAWPALSEKAELGYPNYIHSYLMTAPNQVMISFRLPPHANSPPHKRISAKSNMKVTALVFLPVTWRSKWLWKPEILSIDDIEDIENIDFGNIHLGSQCF